MRGDAERKQKKEIMQKKTTYNIINKLPNWKSWISNETGQQATNNSYHTR